MKAETLRTLLVARTLFGQVDDLLDGNDKFRASASLVIVQDALELVFYALLIEIGADQEKNLERIPFDDAVAELKKKGITVPKSGTIKAMNKERVIVKHYGQIAEPDTVRNYVLAARTAADAVLKSVTGLDMRGISARDLLKDGEAKEFIGDAISYLEHERYLDALVAVRKSLFVEIEIDYVIEEYTSNADNGNMWSFFGKKGHKASTFTKNARWIAENVKSPFDFVQLDHERVRLDLLEWGVNTQDFWNLWRLTPKVYRYVKQTDWLVLADFSSNVDKNSTEYCIDTAIEIIQKKQTHFDSAKFYKILPENWANITAIKGAIIYKKSDTSSEVFEEINEDIRLRSDALLVGLDGKRYFRISDLHAEKKKFYFGFILEEQCQTISA